MSKYTLGKRSDIQISIVSTGEKTDSRGSGWWQSRKPCPVCRAYGKRVYLFTNGKKFVCNICIEKQPLPDKEIGPQQYMKNKEMEK